MDILKVKVNGNWVGIPAIHGLPGADGEKGDTGDSGVYYGTTPPTDPDVNVWINPEGNAPLPVRDVQVNWTSVLSNGVADIPVASENSPGVVKVNTSFGTAMRSSPNQDTIMVYAANLDGIKWGSQSYRPIVPSNQHQSAFYGLAKAAGDTTQSASSNAVGAYTETAKSKIHDMLSAPVSVSGTTPTITALSGVRYICGEVSTITITPPASGVCDVIFESGSTPAVLTVPNTVKWANGFDPTALEADTTYEINILDGLGVACSWS